MKSIRFESVTQFRKAVQKQLGAEIPEKQWERLLRGRHQPFDRADFNAVIEAVSRHSRPEDSMSVKQLRGSSLRREILTRVVQHEVEDNRKRLFGNPAPPFSDLGSMAVWLSAEAGSADNRTVWEQVNDVTGRAIAYPIANGGIEYVTARAGSRLFSLWELATAYALRLGCELHDAVAFILVGITPPVLPITYITEQTTLADGAYIGAITITIREPVSDDELLGTYHTARRKVWRNMRSPRPPTRRDAELLKFHLDMELRKEYPERGKWRWLMERWNAIHPVWEILNWQEFRTAIRRAYPKAYPPPGA
jgi:hypothetical protein